MACASVPLLLKFTVYYFHHFPSCCSHYHIIKLKAFSHKKIPPVITFHPFFITRQYKKKLMHSAYVNVVLFLPFIGKDLVSKSTGQRAKTDEKTGRINSQRKTRGRCNFTSCSLRGLQPSSKSPPIFLPSSSSCHVSFALKIYIFCPQMTKVSSFIGF